MSGQTKANETTATGKLAVIGGGKIGEMVVALLSQRYDVTVFDKDDKAAQRSAGTSGSHHAVVDASDPNALRRVLEGFPLVINCCPHFMNLPIAQAARELDISYCDLSEDVESGSRITQLASGARGYFVPRCGLAPGFIQIVASHIMKSYDEVERCHLRVGALPQNPTNALKYNLTWSTDGLINECGNPCEAIVEGKLKMLDPLEGYERVLIDGVEYEAFNTSGGLGSLAHTVLEKGGTGPWPKVDNLDYKTMRYLGHRDLMKFLMVDLKLNEYRKVLRAILESAVPTTQQDKVVVLVSVVGKRGGLLQQQTYTKVVAHGNLMHRHWTAIQLTTASSLAAVADLVMKEALPHRGLVLQEEIDFEAFCASPYGRIFND